MEYFLIEYNSKTIGVYNNFNDAEIFILGCLQNNLMINSANILTYKINTCFCQNISTVVLKTPAPIQVPNLIQSKQHLPSTNLDQTQLKPDQTQLKHDQTQLKPDQTQLKHDQTQLKPDQTNPEFLELAKQKIELQHRINLLRKQKEKFEESKQVYENDVKLFELFSESKKLDENFVISELFEKKYNIIKRLKEENNLSWDNFVRENGSDTNNYDDYFSENTYDEIYIKTVDKTNNIDEEFEIDSNIESESDTDIDTDSD